MTNLPIRLDDGQLACPLCQDFSNTTHVDRVYVSARKEDRDFNHITVDAVTGQLRTHEITPSPWGDMVKEGRRHRISLVGDCEICGGWFALVFTQHKGTTFVEAVQVNPQDIGISETDEADSGLLDE